MSHWGLTLFAACALVACASGPHPALKVAQSDLGCEQSELKLHQIYPKKVRIEGCGTEAIYVDVCDGYGMDANCGWHRYYANAFERDAAERERAERKEAAARQANEKRAEQERAEQERSEQEEAERAAADKEAADKEAADKEAAEKEKADKEAAEKETAKKETAEEEAEQGTSANADEESSGDDESKPKASHRKPTKATKRGKKSEGMEAFLK